VLIALFVIDQELPVVGRRVDCIPDLAKTEVNCKSRGCRWDGSADEDNKCIVLLADDKGELGDTAIHIINGMY